MGKDVHESGASEPVDKDTIITYLFNDFDSVCMAAHRVQPMFAGDNSLYKYNEKYFLILGKNKKSVNDLEGVVGVLDEFGSRCPSSDLNEYFLKEHGKLLIELHAVDVLSKYL